MKHETKLNSTQTGGEGGWGERGEGGGGRERRGGEGGGGGGGEGGGGRCMGKGREEEWNMQL